MYLLAILYMAVSHIYSKRKRPSPLWGGGAILLMLFILSLFSLLFYPEENELDAPDFVLLYIIINIYSAVISFLIFFITSLILPHIDIASPKISRFPYLLLGIMLTIFTCFYILAEAFAEFLLIFPSTGVTISPLSIIINIGLNLYISVLAIRRCFKYSKEQRNAKNRFSLISQNMHPILYLRSFNFQSSFLSYEKMKEGLLSEHKLFKSSLIEEHDVSIIGSFRKMMYETDPFSIGEKFEKCISNALHKHGTFIALGNPNDYLPSVGAYKIYSTNENWKEYIHQLVDHSRAILLVEGDAPGLHWEFKYVRDFVDPQRVFVLTTPSEYRTLYLGTKHKNLWSTFHSTLVEMGFPSFKEDPGPNAILTFGQDFKPILLAKNLKTSQHYYEVFESFIPKIEGKFDFKQIANVIFSKSPNAKSYEISWLRWIAIFTIGISCILVSIILFSFFYSMQI